ncbi:MAG: HPP family protein [Gammaproteobacteria bacterium]
MPDMKKWTEMLGIELTPVSHTEKMVSALGGFAGIVSILLITGHFVDSASALIVASMGASAVLLFAVPHGALSQPWPVLGGHVISACIGVTCASVIPQPHLAAGLAVGLAIGVMYYLRCIHPPGGATALSAVVGGESVHALGYQFVITPVLLNALIILAIAVLFNFLFAWRRYPASLVSRREQPTDMPAESMYYSPIAHEDLVYALSQIDSFVDISEDDLLRIYALATGKERQRHFNPARILSGHYYSNGQHSHDWAVRQVVDASPGRDPERDMVVYQVVAGAGRRGSGVLTRAEFAAWAREELVHDGNDWKRVSSEQDRSF